MRYSRRTKYKTQRKPWLNLRKVNRAFKRLIKPTAEAAKAIEEIGFQFIDIGEISKKSIGIDIAWDIQKGPIYVNQKGSWN